MTRLGTRKLAERLAYFERYADLDSTPPAERSRARREAAAAREALAASGACRRCGRALRDPRSVELGVGPECLKELTG